MLLAFYCSFIAGGLLRKLSFCTSAEATGRGAGAMLAAGAVPLFVRCVGDSSRTEMVSRAASAAARAPSSSPGAVRPAPLTELPSPNGAFVARYSRKVEVVPGYR